MSIIARRAWLGGVAAVAVVGGAVLWAGWRSAPAPVAIGGPFSLLDGAGRTVTDRDLRGRSLLVYFGYTFCPDVCPTTLAAVAAAVDSLGPDADRVRPVFITVDPRRDTPAKVRDYTAAFSPRLLGLTGSEAAIADVTRAYRVYAAPHRTGPGPDDYTMDHSSILYLMDRDGAFRAVIRTDQSSDAIAAEVRRNLA